MSVRNTFDVSVTSELKAFVTGRNANEVVRAALRLMERHEPEYRAAWRKPDQGGKADR